MNAEIRPIRTPAEQGLSGELKALSRAGGPRIVALRTAAAQAFNDNGLPHRRVEEWKYTDLRTLMREALPLATPAAVAQVEAHQGLLLDTGARRIVVANGAVVPELSDLADLEPGLSILTLAQALAGAGETLARLGTLEPGRYDAALALNTALATDGVVIEVGEGAQIARPVHVAHVVSGHRPAASFARSLVVVGAGAHFTYAESFEGPAGLGYQVNSATEFVVGDEAHLDVVRLQEDSASALHLSTLLFEIGRAAKVHAFSFGIGAGVARTTLYANLAGEDSQVGFNGASLLKGRQHADATLFLDHQVPGCESRELFKTVLDDSARGVFQGKIVVRQAAQKTDGRMMSRALVLGDDAEMDNKPELEIFADDVQCGHGATCGAIDDDLLFYLRARGISLKDAQSLLVQAFVGEAIETVEHDGLREALVARAEAWLAARG
ncbi:Fe-S cluster assembly protein SufD [Ancylobacter amanitiformis]|uniref:Fe-S cluster assembly protein SufD n=1 Tax=Ancylobacter amanitiformis TaxID=217069 RepID=A0ABU0LUG2_9HYPH|nr:Fe-S cluster assembly protein SufD [Ancylobacter amanitiformis]MDQ0512248.1 Fe-S cluster assembly protein SufD [Ancylobacter amanitiformis]